MSTQFVAPQGAIKGGFLAPSFDENKKTKVEDIKLLSEGLHVGVIFGIVDLGTQLNNFGDKKRMIHIAIEFPDTKQKYYEEDDELKSASILNDISFSMYSKAELRKIVNATAENALTDDEANVYDISKMFGKRVLCNIVHNKGKNGKIYANVESYMKVNNYPLPVPFEPTNKYWKFYLDTNGENFKTLDFANLPKFLKDKIMKSDEAIEYIKNGGVFSKKENTNHSAGVPSVDSAPKQEEKVLYEDNEIKMLVSDYSYQDYIKVGWTNEKLVAAGKAIWKELPKPDESANNGPGLPF